MSANFPPRILMDLRGAQLIRRGYNGCTVWQSICGETLRLPHRSRRASSEMVRVICYENTLLRIQKWGLSNKAHHCGGTCVDTLAGVVSLGASITTIPQKNKCF